MLRKIDEMDLGGGYVIEWAYCDDVESPRAWDDNLGHFHTWVRGYSSPDENPYADEVQFVSSMLQERFTHEELLGAVRAGKLPTLRLEADGEGVERLLALYRNMLTGKVGWDVVQDYEDCRDLETLADAAACSAGAPALLGERMVIKTVYMLEHSGIAFSTSPFCDRWDSGAVGFIYADGDDVSSWFGGMRASRDKVEEILDAEVERYSAWANGESYAVMLSKGDEMVDCVGGYIGDEELEIGIADMRGQVPSAA